MSLSSQRWANEELTVDHIPLNQFAIDRSMKKIFQLAACCFQRFDDIVGRAMGKPGDQTARTSIILKVKM